MTKQLLVIFSAAVLLLPARTFSAQEQFRMLFHGVCRAQNDAGRLVTVPLSERDILRACAADSGLTNIRNLKLVYNRGADYNGDAIQVVTASNGVVVCTPFKLLFQKAVPSANGVQVEHLAFVYDSVQSDAIGSATITERNYYRRNGSLIRTVLVGKMQFWDQVYHTNSICKAVFMARQP